MNRIINGFFGSIILCSSFQASAETQVLEIAASSSAGMYSNNCCTISYASGFNNSVVRTSNCQSVYMSCVSSKRAGMWLFEIPSMPEGATILNVSFAGTREFNDMTGSGFITVKSNVESLNTQVGLDLWSGGDWQAYINWNYGTNFSFPLTSAWTIAGFDKAQSVALLAYGSNTGGIDIPNTGSAAPKLRITLSVPEVVCTFDLDANDVVDASDLGIFLALWNSTNTDADFNEDGIVDSSDLGLLLAGWGSCL